MKHTKHIDTSKNITIMFGYSLFALTLLTVILSTIIPFGLHLFSPSARHFNIAVLLVFLVAGAILPLLVSYILGDNATHKKNKTSHHLNGVLFGVAAYWLYLLFSFIATNTVGTIWDSFSIFLAHIINSWPILATILIMIFVATTYARHQKGKASVLQHRPYQIVLLGTVACFLAYVATHQRYDESPILTALSVSSLLLPIIQTVISYTVLSHQGSRLARVSSAVIAMSIGMIAASLSGQFISYFDTSFPVNIALSQLTGLLVWGAYLWLVSRNR